MFPAKNSVRSATATNAVPQSHTESMVHIATANRHLDDRAERNGT